MGIVKNRAKCWHNEHKSFVTYANWPFNFSFKLFHLYFNKIHYSNPQSKEISWQALLMDTFLLQLSNLPGNLMVYYTVAKIC